MVIDKPELITKRSLIVIIAIVALTLVTLHFEGRVIWCRLGDYLPWSFDIWSGHNSQHIVDPYSFTHVLHGVLEFWLIGLIFRKMPLAWRLVLAVFVESAWEIAENSSHVINRYRAETISLDYFGDSIINSMADITCCALGFYIAYKLKFWKSLALFLLTETILLLTIRDSLIVNIIMLVHPVEAIKAWQTAG